MKQGYNARLDDSMGSRSGSKSQSLKDRRDESEGMEKSRGKRKFSGNKSSAQGMSMAGGGMMEYKKGDKMKNPIAQVLFFETMNYNYCGFFFLQYNCTEQCTACCT